MAQNSSPLLALHKDGCRVYQFDKFSLEESG